MKKKQGIFIAIFCLLLAIMSGTVLSLYDNVKESSKATGQDIVAQNYYDFGYYTLALQKALDPDYEVLIYTKEIPESVQNICNKYINDNLEGYLSVIQNDSDLMFEAINTKTNKKISHHEDDLSSKTDKMFDGTIDFTTDKRAILKGDFDKNIFDHYVFDNIAQDALRYYHDIYMDPTDIEYENGNGGYSYQGIQYADDSIQVNIPKDLSVTFALPENVTESSYFYNDTYYESYYYGFAAAAMAICCGILFMFFLIYPVTVVENAPYFKASCRMKAGTRIILLGALIGAWVTGCIMVCAITLNGQFSDFFDLMNIGYSDTFIPIINFVVWFITLAIASLEIFQIKYIFAHGVMRYLKEDTLTASLIRKIKKYIQKLSEIDLSNPLEKTILKFVLMNTVAIFLMCTTWIFGYFLAIIYAIICFYYIVKKANNIQQDYLKIVGAAKQLGNGNFDVDIQDDLGMFNGLKEDFSHIRDGFEKAVKEETKSQHMKTELISNVSHDLKTPLTCIKNYIVLLQDDQLDEATRHEYLENLNQYSNRLTTLIEDLFDVSKVNSGNMKLSLMDINIIALIEQAQAECIDQLEEKGLTIIPSFEESEIICYLDGDKTYRIFENLFTNISKYAMPNSRVYIEVHELAEDVEIIFKNISMAQMNFTAEEIVDRFVRGDKSRHETGSGLGLAIVKSFTEIQKGSFHIEIDGDLFKAILHFKKERNQA